MMRRARFTIASAAGVVEIAPPESAAATMGMTERP